MFTVLRNTPEVSTEDFRHFMNHSYGPMLSWSPHGVGSLQKFSVSSVRSRTARTGGLGVLEGGLHRHCLVQIGGDRQREFLDSPVEAIADDHGL
ncbi:hypothetical protein D5S17_19680 [Pseudonocardiaceae bacterium YIM PH 21723]|nr:hypothetical protein D5S17_19680 [Pseudonocardiaceae bacterium YIM PH 21723]